MTATLGTDAELVARVWRAEPAASAVRAVLDRLGQPAWLVGGAVRDALLGRDISDWDVLCADPLTIAAAIAQTTGGRLVVLHEEPATCRVVLDAGTPRARFLDFVAFRAPTLEGDLGARDFTINASALTLPDGPLLDPQGGRDDLLGRRLRALSRAGLEADPLRCLRAYRFHSELGFAITPETRAELRELAHLLPTVAGERAGAEVLKLLRPPRAAETLALMAEDGVLWQLIPELRATAGVPQGGFHHLDVWGHTLAVVASMEGLLTAPREALPGSPDAVAAYLAEPDRPAMLLLAALLHDVSKPECLQADGSGKTRFFGHETAGARVAGRVARRQALRGDLREALQRLVANHMRPVLLGNLALPTDERPAQAITLGALRRLFRDAEPDGVGLLLLALADVRGCRGPATRPGYHEAVAGVLDDMLRRYRRWQDEMGEAPLLTGEDLIAAGYEPGPAFGRALRAVDEARADGLVGSPEDALALARRLLAEEAGAGETDPVGESER